MNYTLFIDESGNMSKNNGEKYFSIGGYLINSGDDKHKYKMIKIIKNINKNREKYFNYYALKDELTEVKFSNLNLEGKKYVFNSLKELGGTFVGIIVDKENCHTLTSIDTNEDYNFLVCQLVKYIFETCKHAGSIDFEELYIVYDYRSMKVKARNGLQSYLLDQLKNKRCEKKQFSCNFNIKAADSKINYGVMVADFVAGLCRDIYRNKNSELKGVITIKYLSRFPFKDFDKKIIPKEIEVVNKNKILTKV